MEENIVLTPPTLHIFMLMSSFIANPLFSVLCKLCLNTKLPSSSEWSDWLHVL